MLFLKSLTCPGIIPLVSILSSPCLTQKMVIQSTGAFAELPKASQEEYMSGLKGRLFSIKIPSGKVFKIIYVMNFLCIKLEVMITI